MKNRMLKRIINTSSHGMKPCAIIADWDETITVEDTIKLVSKAAYNAKPGFQPDFSYFTDVYSRAYENYMNSLNRDIVKRDTLEKVWKFHEGMRNVELASINEITERGLFKGLTKLQFEEQSKNVKIRPYFFEFLCACEKLEIPVIILSINWTSLIMERVLNDHGFKRGKNLEFIVNEFEMVDSKTTGRWVSNPTVRTGIDKVNILRQLKMKYKDVLFVGDSSTDLLSLVEASFGVVMEGGSVLSSFEKLNIPCKSFDDSLRNENDIITGNWKDLLNFIEN